MFFDRYYRSTDIIKGRNSMLSVENDMRFVALKKNLIQSVEVCVYEHFNHVKQSLSLRDMH